MHIPWSLARNCTQRWPTRHTLSFEKHKDPRIMCMWPGWSSNQEAERWVTANHWLLPITQQIKRKPLTSYEEALSCTDKWIKDLPFFMSRGNPLSKSPQVTDLEGSPIHHSKSQRDIPLGESLQVNDLDGWQDYQSAFPKDEDKPSWTSCHKLTNWMNSMITDLQLTWFDKTRCKIF